MQNYSPPAKYEESIVPHVDATQNVISSAPIPRKALSPSGFDLSQQITSTLNVTIGTVWLHNIYKTYIFKSHQRAIFSIFGSVFVLASVPAVRLDNMPVSIAESYSYYE